MVAVVAAPATFGRGTIGTERGHGTARAPTIGTQHGHSPTLWCVAAPRTEADEDSGRTGLSVSVRYNRRASVRQNSRTKPSGMPSPDPDQWSRHLNV